MSIELFAAGTYRSGQTTTSLVAMKSRLDTLTTQLATGRTAESYAGLGSGRTTSLSARASVSALDGYASAISGATTRIKLANTSLTQLTSLGGTMRQALLSDLRSTSVLGVRQSTSIAGDSLQAAVDALNQNSAGTYLFSGRAVDTAPVIAASMMIDGDPSAGLAGLRQLIAEQKAADLGSGTGRLSQSVSGSIVTLGEDPDAEARANFGFSLINATSSGTGVSAGLTAGTPATVNVAFASQPQDGDRVRVAVLQPDGSQKILDLTARASATGVPDTFQIGADATATAANLQTALGGAPIASVQSASPPGISATFSGGSAASLSLNVGTPSAGETVTVTLGMRDGTTKTITLTAKAAGDGSAAGDFEIGANPAATAANLSAALDTAIRDSAANELAGGSATRAAEDFFDGSLSPGMAPRRVAPGGNGYVETASASTVIWYRGDDQSADPRATATVRIGADRNAAIGAQANEEPIRAMLAGIAVLAADTFTDASGTASVRRFQATAERAQTLLTASDGGGSVEAIASQFGLAARNMDDASSQIRSTKLILEDAIAGVEQISTEEVIAQLLNLQTQLQASYQVTSMTSQLSLVNYL